MEKVLNWSKIDRVIINLAGSYTIGAEVRNNRFSGYLDMVVNAINFQVVESYSHGGVAELKPECRIDYL